MLAPNSIICDPKKREGSFIPKISNFFFDQLLEMYFVMYVWNDFAYVCMYVQC